MERKTYKVITGLEKKWWWIEIPGVDMGFSQAKSYRQVEAMAREVISLLMDVPEDSFDVTIEVRGDEAEVLRKVALTEEAAREAKLAADAEKRKAITSLRATGVPVRDVAELLHVSPGWVSELGKEKLSA